MLFKPSVQTETTVQDHIKAKKIPLTFLMEVYSNDFIMYLITFQSSKIIHLNSDLILSLLFTFSTYQFSKHVVVDFFLSLWPSYTVSFKMIAILQIAPFNQLALKPFINSLVVFTRTVSSIFSHFQKSGFLIITFN